MNYKKIYDQLIAKAQAENRKKLPKTDPNYVYYEAHHIVPKCMNGSNDASNIVNLTFREHYMAHLLLAKHYKDTGDKPLYFKMAKALTAFECLDFGTIRNGLFFASKLFRTITRSYEMPQSTKDLLSVARTGKKWTEKQRKANEAYHENLKNAGIKLIPWNKGIPLAQETKDKMHNTIVTKGNKNKGRKAATKSKILEIRHLLERHYPIVNFDSFDFDTYVQIPKNEKICKLDDDGNIHMVYARREFLMSFLITQLPLEEIYRLQTEWKSTHNKCGKGKKMCLSGKTKIFKRKFEKYYKVDFSDFDFSAYFSIINIDNDIQRRDRKIYVLKYVNEKEQQLATMYFY